MIDLSTATETNSSNAISSADSIANSFCCSQQSTHPTLTNTDSTVSPNTPERTTMPKAHVSPFFSFEPSDNEEQDPYNNKVPSHTLEPSVNEEEDPFIIRCRLTCPLHLPPSLTSPSYHRTPITPLSSTPSSHQHSFFCLDLPHEALTPSDTVKYLTATDAADVFLFLLSNINSTTTSKLSTTNALSKCKH
jgi:hypothetical protein